MFVFIIFSELSVTIRSDISRCVNSRNPCVKSGSLRVLKSVKEEEQSLNSTYVVLFFNYSVTVNVAWRHNRCPWMF